MLLPQTQEGRGGWLTADKGTLGKVLSHGVRGPSEGGKPNGGRSGRGLEERLGSAEKRGARDEPKEFGGPSCRHEHVEGPRAAW